jgi:hypothetical protein
LRDLVVRRGFVYDYEFDLTGKQQRRGSLDCEGEFENKGSQIVQTEMISRLSIRPTFGRNVGGGRGLSSTGIGIRN